MSGYCWQLLYDALEEAGRDVRLALSKEVNTPLWRAGLPRQARKLIKSRLRTILSTLRNSVRRHLVDGDVNRLR